MHLRHLPHIRLQNDAWVFLLLAGILAGAFAAGAARLTTSRGAARVTRALAALACLGAVRTAGAGRRRMTGAEALAALDAPSHPHLALRLGCAAALLATLAVTAPLWGARSRGP